MKEQQKQYLIDIMKADEELGLYGETLDKKSYLLGYSDAMKKIDSFAIGFSEFCIQSKVHFFDDTENGKIYLVDLYKTKYMMSELLQIYKNNIYDTKR
jgi:hypothetical protein